MGRTGNIGTRMRSYPKGSKLIMAVEVSDMFAAERQLLKSLESSQTRRKDIGSEYFCGNVAEIMTSVSAVAAQHRPQQGSKQYPKTVNTAIWIRYLKAQGIQCLYDSWETPPLIPEELAQQAFVVVNPVNRKELLTVIVNEEGNGTMEDHKQYAAKLGEAVPRPYIITGVKPVFPPDGAYSTWQKQVHTNHMQLEIIGTMVWYDPCDFDEMWKARMDLHLPNCQAGATLAQVFDALTVGHYHQRNSVIASLPTVFTPVHLAQDATVNLRCLVWENADFSWVHSSTECLAKPIGYYAQPVTHSSDRWAIDDQQW